MANKVEYGPNYKVLYSEARAQIERLTTEMELCIFREWELTSELAEVNRQVWMMFNPDSVTTYEGASKWLDEWIETPDEAIDAAMEKPE